MPRAPRMLITGESTAYHVMSRTALEGFPLGDVEKETFVSILSRLSKLYLTEIIGFCLMGNHFHLLVRMHDAALYSDDAFRKRLQYFYGEDRIFGPDQLPRWREKLSSLSEFVRELKVTFARYYNRTHHRKGYFWGDRFKSVIVENGETLVNCLAYIDLNPVRAGLVEKPEEYRFNSIGHHIQSKNKWDLLSTDFGMAGLAAKNIRERIRRYRQFLYEKGGISAEGKINRIKPDIVQKERKRNYELSPSDRFLYRTRYFTDGGIIGTKNYVSRVYTHLKERLPLPDKKPPRAIKGLSGIYSIRQLG